MDKIPIPKTFICKTSEWQSLCNLADTNAELLEKAQGEIADLKDKLHRRNMQIKDLKIALKIESEIKTRFNKQLRYIEGIMDDISGTSVSKEAIQKIINNVNQ